MIIDSKYAKIFKSYLLTRSKYDELYTVAVKLRDFKNGTFRPKPLNRDKVKEVLLSCHNNITNDIEKSKLLTSVNNY